jgi:type IV pilus assembly protein PilP
MGGGEHGDLRQWMDEASRNLPRKVPPLPQVKPYEPVAYDAGNSIATNPFDASRAIPEQVKKGGGKQPDFDRPREPLEAYPLESLKYVGFLKFTGAKPSHAVILADGSLHNVRAGNYLGQNFGVITKIDESEVTLKELVQDAEGDWIERVSSLLLVQGQEGTK